jgi:type II secretion system protein G
MFEYKNKINNKKRGFTLIELLVVISIIGMLSSVVLSSLNDARAKARDARRMSDIKQIQNALEMYRNDKGFYPKQNEIYLYASEPYLQTTCGFVNTLAPQGAWCKLEEVLSPYISQLPRDRSPFVNNRYLYIGKTSDMWGLRVILEKPNDVSKNDGGYDSSWYEVGPLPSYCMQKYSGSNANWANWDHRLCLGGN